MQPAFPPRPLVEPRTAIHAFVQKNPNKWLDAINRLQISAAQYDRQIDIQAFRIGLIQRLVAETLPFLQPEMEEYFLRKSNNKDGTLNNDSVRGKRLIKFLDKIKFGKMIDTVTKIQKQHEKQPKG